MAYFFPDVGVPPNKAAFFGLIVGGVLIVGAVALPFLGRWGSGADESFRRRALDYVAAFAEAAEGWLQEGDLETLGDAARFMLLGSAASVEVVWGGEEVVRESRVDLSLPPVEDAGARASSLDDDGGRFLDVLYPLPQGDGYVRVLLEYPSPEGVPVWLPLATGVLAALGLGAVGGSLYLHLRRAPPPPGGERSPIRVGGLVIDEARKEVRLLGKPVRLSPKQYALLVLLAREPGRVFSDREILEEIWAGSRYANSKDVKQYVYLLRRRLGEVVPGAESLIATVPGFGYKLLSPEEIGLTGR